MTGRQQPAPPRSEVDQKRGAEKTRKVIKELAEAPPAKTMAEVKAASEVFEATALQRKAVHRKDGA